MNQFENGIGMVREFLTNFNRRRSRLKNLKSKRRALFLTGHSAHSFLSTEVLPHVTKELKLKLKFHPVTNRFWGESVTVSGLLTGQDLLRDARAMASEYDVVVLPPNCLNQQDLFLDNLSLEQFRNVLNKPVLVGQYDLAATIKEVYV
jgi:NifB/MoaA-like Fe-S oxidoreductase